MVPGLLAADPPAAGLIGYWAFDGDFDDASGNGNHADTFGAVLVPDRYGRPDRAVEVSRDHYLTVPDSPSLALTEAFTIALWLRQDAVVSAFNCFLGKDYTTAFSVGIDSGGSGDCPDPDRSRPVVVYVGDRRRQFSQPSFDCGTGEWRHVAVTFDASNGETRLYVDGGLVSATTNSGTLAASASDLGIGRDGRHGDTFTGLLDEVCLYNRVLDEAEITALYSGEMLVPTVEFPGIYSTVIAASAHTAGLNQTSWLTDLVLHNRADRDAVIDLFFLASRTDNTDATPHRVVVPANSSLLLADVVASVFGRDRATGAILVGADAPIIVSSRTFNDASAGTYGQFIGGQRRPDATAGTGSLLRLVQLAHSPEASSGFRTNIGAVNLGAAELSLEIALYTGAGAFLGTIELVVPPYGHLQVSNVFGDHANQALDDAFARVLSGTAGARYQVYASVVDNRSGDPVFIAAR
jgi:hypothetical protein